MMDVAPSELEKHIKTLHSVDSNFITVEEIEEYFQGDLVWSGKVHIFELIDHDKADTCFTWSSSVEGSENRKFYAVLKIPPVESAQDAVKASIVSDYQTK